MRYKTLLIALVVFGGCSPSFGEPGQRPALPTAAESAQHQLQQDRVACETDVKKLCATWFPSPGDPTVLNCLLKHKAELTEACRKNVETHEGNARDLDGRDYPRYGGVPSFAWLLMFALTVVGFVGGWAFGHFRKS